MFTIQYTCIKCFYMEKKFYNEKAFYCKKLFSREKCK